MKQMLHEPILKKINQFESQAECIARMFFPEPVQGFVEFPMFGDMLRRPFIIELLEISFLRREMSLLVPDNRVEQLRDALRIGNTMDDVHKIIDHPKHLLVLLVKQSHTDAILLLPFKDPVLSCHMIVYRYYFSIIHPESTGPDHPVRKPYLDNEQPYPILIFSNEFGGNINRFQS